MRRRRRKHSDRAVAETNKTEDGSVIGNYDAALEGRLLTWQPNSPAPSMLNRLFRKRPTGRREAHYGEGEDPEIGPPF